MCIHFSAITAAEACGGCRDGDRELAELGVGNEGDQDKNGVSPCCVWGITYPDDGIMSTIF